MKTMKKMMTLIAVVGLVLALAPAAQAATTITLTNPTGPSLSGAYPVVRVINDPFTALAYDPDASPNTAQPIQGPGTGGTYLWLSDGGEVFSADIDSIPVGESLAFIDVWGTTGGGGSGGYDRTRNLVFTLSDGANSWSNTAAPWNGLYYSAAPDQNPGPGFGRFDFTGAGVTDDLLTLATSLSIYSINGETITGLAEIRLVSAAGGGGSTPGTLIYGK
ncbi:MAG: hypothetical protein OSB41_10805 [Kiritimatiellae bacterium]|nr:hypothetical protein [Kiritimatiellia bacterium]